eukprot:scaffold39444_cov58-Attheya_sp.AAC.1
MVLLLERVVRKPATRKSSDLIGTPHPPLLVVGALLLLLERAVISSNFFKWQRSNYIGDSK